jgi:hypothetical protein
MRYSTTARTTQSKRFWYKRGLTYSKIAKSFSAQPFPEKSIFTAVGFGIFPVDESKLWSWLGFFNSKPVCSLLSLYSADRHWHNNYLAALPVPNQIDAELSHLSKSIYSIVVKQGQSSETAPEFISPFATITDEEYLALPSYIKTVEKMVADAIGLSEQTIEFLVKNAIYRDFELEKDTDNSHWDSIISWLTGCSFGRWDIRVGRDSDLSPKISDPFADLPMFPPGTLIMADGRPAIPNNIVSEAWLKALPDAITLPEMRARGAEQVVVLDGKEYPATIPDNAYPLPIPWDGILVDDPGLDGKSPHPEDLVERALLVLRLLWPENHAAIEAEACEILGVRELRDHFRKPGGFFADHLKRYSKSRRQAPIYWPLSTASGAYTLWLYYPRLSAETLPTALNRFVDPKIAAVSDYVAALEVRLNQISGRASTDLRDELDRQKALLAELRDFRAELLRISALPYRPDLNDGVILNAAPFHRLFRLGKWSKDAESAWKKLQGGEYEWSHIAYILWPERVREVCKTDKSIAIAHGLEGLYVETAPKKSKGKRKSAVEEDEMGL